jgi:drug/metabolite transporter (DMT)-like permease
MIYILLSILCSTILVLLLRLFGKYEVNTFQAILFNYYTCVASAWVTMGHFPIPSDLAQKDWFPFALILGFTFITGFNAVGGTIRYFGVALGSITQKMTLLFVVIFSVLYYHESVTWSKVLGIILSIAAIFLTSYSVDNQENTQENKKTLLDWLRFPVAALLLSSVIDVLLLYLQKSTQTDSADVSFVASLFGTAGVLGTVYFIYGLLTKQMIFDKKNVLAGIVLGVPNFASIVFLLKSIGQKIDGSVVFTLTNVGIIVASTLGAWLFFKEKMGFYKIIGVAMAVVAIVLIAK